MKRARGRWIIFLFAVWVSGHLSAQEEQKEKIPWIELNGYVKNLQTVSFPGIKDSSSSAGLIHNRLNLALRFNSRLSARLEVRNRLFYGEQVRMIPGFGDYIDQYQGYFDWSRLWVDNRGMVLHSVIDRALVRYADKHWDVRLGRQRINWGINTIWNPNDIFNAYNFLDFDYEERPGNDALRIQHFGKNSSLELAYKPGKKKDESTTALLYKTNRHQYDIQVLGGIYKSDYVAGLGWAGNIKNAGFKGELSYFHPKEKLQDTTGTLAFTLMADQTFKNDWYASVSMLYNSQPANQFGGGTGLYSTTLSAKSLFPFRYTFYAGVMKSLNPINSVNVSVIYSPYNNTLILFPVLTWNAASNLDIDLTLQSAFGEQQTGYKTLGTSVYLRGRWSF